MIELKNVDKKFQDIHAADHITASVRDGLIFGLVGSNGAGKSTLLRMICGVVKPDSGEILDGWGVCIREPRRQNHRSVFCQIRHIILPMQI